MRFHSTLDSVQKGEITKLAIIECFISVALYVGIAIHFKTFRYFTTAIALAPLTLLRTDASMKWGLKKWERATDLIPRFQQYAPYKFAFAILPLIALSGLVIRLTATLYWSVRAPFETLQGMPQNWLRQALCTDFFYPPEVVPLEAVYRREYQVVNLLSILELVKEHVKDYPHERTQTVILTGILFGPFCVVAFLPSIIYRISYKATSLIYYPFVWVAGVTVASKESLKTRLERFTKGELEKTRRLVSGIVATALAIKVGLALGWLDFSEALAKIPFKKLVETFLVPQVWHWWQITLGVDALLTFCLLFYADAALGRLDTKDAWNGETVTKTISGVSFLRASLAILTMSHFFWLAFTTTTGRYITL